MVVDPAYDPRMEDYGAPLITGSGSSNAMKQAKRATAVEVADVASCRRLCPEQIPV